MGKSEPVEKNQKRRMLFPRSPTTPTATQNDKILVSRKTTANILKPPVTVDGTVDENFVTCPKCNLQIRMWNCSNTKISCRQRNEAETSFVGHQIPRKKQKTTKKKGTVNGQNHHWFSSWKTLGTESAMRTTWIINTFK